MKIKNLFLLIFSGIIILAIAAFIMAIVIINNQNELSKSEEVRFESYLRADELRQSFDDLTRLARTYVVSGDPKYEKLYWDVLDVRNGVKARPQQYERIYWDYLSYDGKKPRPDDVQIPLEDLFKRLGFTAEEFLKLKESQNNSHELVRIETVAMNAVKGIFADASGKFTVKDNPNMELARELMHSVDYHREKIRIMRPIDDFLELLDSRTKATVEGYKTKSLNYLIALVVFTVLLIIFCVSGYIIVNRSVIQKLGCDPAEIEYITSKISKGILDLDFQKEQSTGVLNSLRIMTKSLNDMAKTATAISNGDLTVTVEPQSEKDVIQTTFAMMLNNLRSQIIEIYEGVNVLSSSSAEIMAASLQLSSVATETATSVSEISTTIEEVKQTVELSNQKAQQVSEKAQLTIAASQNGNKSIEETIKGMNRIKQQMGSIAGIVVGLSEQSQSIGEIANSVNDLAEQSNLLAVNASIEAAEAGEQGKGFAVVAQEIKSLAEQSKNSTRQIRTILNDIQKAISDAVMATEQGGKAVDEGLELSNISSEVIQTLSASVKESAQASLQIAASSQQQLVGMDQITVAIYNIKEASTQTAASTKQSEQSVNDLQKLGKRLQGILKQYKL